MNSIYKKISYFMVLCIATLSLTTQRANACLDIPEWAIPILIVVAGPVHIYEAAKDKSEQIQARMAGFPKIDIKKPDGSDCDWRSDDKTDTCHDIYSVKHSLTGSNKNEGKILVVEYPRYQKSFTKEAVQSGKIKAKLYSNKEEMRKDHPSLLTNAERQLKEDNEFYANDDLTRYDYGAKAACLDAPTCGAEKTDDTNGNE